MSVCMNMYVFQYLFKGHRTFRIEEKPILVLQLIPLKQHKFSPLSFFVSLSCSHSRASSISQTLSSEVEMEVEMDDTTNPFAKYLAPSNTDNLPAEGMDM